MHKGLKIIFGFVFAAFALIIFVGCGDKPASKPVNPSVTIKAVPTAQEQAMQVLADSRALGKKVAREADYRMTKSCDILPMELGKMNRFGEFQQLAPAEYKTACKQEVLAMHYERQAHQKVLAKKSVPAPKVANKQPKQLVTKHHPS